MSNRPKSKPQLPIYLIVVVHADNDGENLSYAHITTDKKHAETFVTDLLNDIAAGETEYTVHQYELDNVMLHSFWVEHFNR